MNPENALKYVSDTLFLCTAEHKIDIQILKSVLIYQCLYYTEFHTLLSVDDILLYNENEIGFIGPGNGCTTGVLEKLFGKFKCCHVHSALHYAYGRFYTKYKKGRGYSYVLKKAPKFLKTSSLLENLNVVMFIALFMMLMVVFIQNIRKAVDIVMY